MSYIRRVSVVALIAFLLFAVSVAVFAHPGRTDGNGGHTNHSTGEYHYHHGYSAHSHYDMDNDGDIDCPYDFDDKTNHSSGNIASNSSTVSTIPTQTKRITVGDILKAMLQSLLPAIAIGLTTTYLLWYLFYFIFGQNKSLTLAGISFVFISVIAFIWLVIAYLH